MKIGIVNTGNIGGTLARAWARRGHQLMLAKDGTTAKLDALLKELGPAARRGTFAEAAAFGDMVLFSVYWPRFEFMLREVGSALAGKVVIDTTNPLRVDENFNHFIDIEFLAHNSAAEELQHRVPSAKVVKAFSTIAAPWLDVSSWDEVPTKPAILCAGDDAAAKTLVFTLVRDAGFPYLDAGSLSVAREIERLPVLVHAIAEANGGDDGKPRFAPTFLSPPAHQSQ